MEQWTEKAISRISHEHTANDKAEAGHTLNAFQPLQCQVVALISLLGLHQREKDGSQQEDPAH